ncbi:glycosyltransferase family 2 protein [Psychromonas sp. Urea-02u-13]|uniref:glycosyltransferase family 2 protein n=1 Tax=Psychromonas sp. Urea-02u-13 TaxID=2058326 RepID=UPI000C343DC5|nr:glycosyltransferase family 2 protein [Psychromonas sp. Urea-02u-13]PKG37913.1 glycosyltransferase family 2 protein [Psychromonas sp. Urea-02u-13]
MDNMIIILTLISGFLVIYHHLGYPLILKLFKKQSAQLHQHQQQQQQTNGQSVNPPAARQYTCSNKDNDLPNIAIVVPAYNEAQWIAEKIRNLAALDYPSGHLQVIIGCDGCQDKTYAIAKATAAEPECAELAITIINFQINRGKIALLNELLPTLKCDLVALTDTSALISIDALMIAANRFKDPKIGVLNGHYRLLTPGSAGEQAYWDYQSEIKISEAALGSTLGAHGAFYLFRRELFEPLASDTINDDFILPMKIVAAGYRADYENSINALELEKSSDDQDHMRRRRIAAGNVQQLLRLKMLLLPRYKGVAFAFISGKALRVLMPFLMIISLLGCLLLASHYLLFLALAVAQLMLYGLASWQLLMKPKQSNKVSRLLGYLVGGHVAGLIGTIRYVLHLDGDRWTKIN